MKKSIFTILVAVLGSFALWYSFQPGTIKPVKLYDTKVATVIDPVKILPDFSLTDSNSKTFTNVNLYGSWSLVFFGYSSCREICPTTLMSLSQTIKEMKNPKNLQVLFVSLDPEKDTPQTLKEMLTRFDPNIIGLTGEESIIEELAKACNVFHWKDENSEEIDHSGTVILLNPEGQIRAYFSPPLNPNEIVHDLNILMKS